MMEYKKIRDKIEAAVIAGNKKFIIYPFGEMGSLTKRILNESFGIRECYICDNKLSKINPEIKGLDYFKELNVDEYTVLFTCADNRIYREVYSTLRKIFPEDAIVECFSKENYAGGY